jgi:hypothetical protein
VLAGCSKPPPPSPACRERARQTFERLIRTGTPDEAKHARQQLDKLRTDPNSVQC